MIKILKFSQIKKINLKTLIKKNNLFMLNTI